MAEARGLFILLLTNDKGGKNPYLNFEDLGTENVLLCYWNNLTYFGNFNVNILRLPSA